MSVCLLNEDEQVDALKRWWKSYGMTALMAIVIGVTAMFAYQYWQNNRLTTQGQASTIYQILLSEVDNNQSARQEKQIAYIRAHYPNTLYAGLASLFAAKQAVLNAQLNTAGTELSQAAQHVDTKIWRALSNLRLARVKLAEQQVDAALTLLSTIDIIAFKPAVDDLRGDILVQQGQHAAAKIAYRTALDESRDNQPFQELLQLKLDNLAE